MAKHGVIFMIAGTVAVAGVLYFLHKTTQPKSTTRILSTPPPQSSKQTCPKNCPMLRNNKCISNKCILEKPRTNVTPAKAGEIPEAEVCQS